MPRVWKTATLVRSMTAYTGLILECVKINKRKRISTKQRVL